MKLLKLICIPVMLAALIMPQCAALSAAELSGYCGDNATWTISGNTLTISGSGDMWDYPYSVSNSDNYSLPPWFDFDIDKLVIDEGVTSIGTKAFMGMTISELEFSEGLKSIGSHAFERAKISAPVRLPEGLESIGTEAFDSSDIKEIYIPDSVTQMGSSCFYACSELYAVRLSNSLSYIPAGAFYRCTSLAYIKIPDSVSEIKAYAFEYSGLQSVVIPGTVKNISYEAIDLFGTKFIEFEDGVQNAGDVYITDDSAEIIIPSSVTAIDLNFSDTPHAVVKYAGSESDLLSITESHSFYPNCIVFNADISNKPSDWAEELVREAENYGMTVDKRYTWDIMRYEFCSLIHSFLESAAPEKLSAGTNTTMMDELDDMYDLIATGIIMGNGDGDYTPYYSITREEAAVIINRVWKLLGTSESDYAKANISDYEDVSSWARDAVNELFSNGLLQGEESDKGTVFLPKDSYSREEAIVTLMRAINALNTKGA